MKMQRLAVALTLVNLGILAFQLLSHARPALATATADDPAPMLRGRGLQIVDERGKVRASIQVLPESVFKQTGEKIPETVLLRLIDPNGRPGVKIGTSADGGGMSLAGDSEKREWNGAQILARAKGTSVILTNKDGKKQVLEP
jgi:hypothetical protein